MSLCFPFFERFVAELISLETEKKYFKFLCAMTAGKCLLRSEFPKCLSLFPVTIGSYLKLWTPVT